MSFSESAADRRAPRVHVALIEPEIPWNAGNLGRTCVATGVRLHLVGPLGFSIADREVRRAGLDYWRHVDLMTWPDFATFERALPGIGAPWLFSAEAETTLWEAAIEPPAVLLFGSETHGFGRELRERYRDRLVRLPMVEGPVRSLNVSTAAAVAVYEVLRRQCRPAVR